MLHSVPRWHGVAVWKWDVNEDVCGICRLAFDACCPDCTVPGDNCSPGKFDALVPSFLPCDIFLRRKASRTAYNRCCVDKSYQVEQVSVAGYARSVSLDPGACLCLK